MGRISGVTREQIVRETEAALDKHGGNRAAAAAELGIDDAALRGRINRNDQLRLRWAGVGSSVRESMPRHAPKEAVTIYRDVLPSALGKHTSPTFQKINDDNENIAAAVEKEDLLVRTGVQNLGLSKDQMELAMSFQSFQRRFFTTSFEMLGGGITRQFVTLVSEIESISERLKNSTELTPSMEAILREDRSRLLAIQVQMYDRAAKAALIQIEVNNRLKGGGSGKQAGKPGFTPLAMQVKGDVHIHQPKEPATPPAETE